MQENCESKGKNCQIKGCERAVKAIGLCSAHYDRARAGTDMAKPVRTVFRGGDDTARFMSKVKVSEAGCWEWQASRTPAGYGQFRFRGTRELAHRVAWTLFKGEIPADPTGNYGVSGVLHQCDNPACVNPEHLFLGNQSANTLDSISKGRWIKRGAQGEAHGRALITEDDVRAIRASELPGRKLAEQYGISAGAVQHIRKRRSWKHIE